MFVTQPLISTSFLFPFFRSDPKFLHHPSDHVCVCLRIAKVLTVQVVIRHIYCSGGTSSDTSALAWKLLVSSCLISASPPVRLCAKVHLVQIVK